MRSRRMSAGSSSAESPKVCKEKEVLVDLQRCSTGRESALDQEEPEPPRIKEEQEELCTTQEDEQLDGKQEDRACLHPHFKPKPEETFGVSESDAVQSEEETEEHRPSEITWRPTDRHVPQQHECKDEEEDEEVRTEEPPCLHSRPHHEESENPLAEEDGYINSVESNHSEEHCGADRDLHLPADTEVLPDCQLSRIQEERTPPPMKGDHEDVGTSEESRQVNLKDEADTFTITLSYEDSNSEPGSENQDHQESKLEEAPTYGEPNPRKRQNRTKLTPYLSETGHNNRASKNLTLTDSEKGPGAESLHYCKMCGKCFLKKCNLTAHIRTHTGEKPFTCDSCGKRFSQNSHLRVHMTTHTGEKSYTCKMCEKTFSRSVNLLRHMRTHTDEKPYPCDTCGKRFSQSFDLLRHERSHTGEKPYPCTMCDKTFSQHSNLLYHTRTHTGEKPYLCVTCGKRFSQSSHVWRHMAVHGGGKSQH